MEMASSTPIQQRYDHHQDPRTRTGLLFNVEADDDVLSEPLAMLEATLHAQEREQNSLKCQLHGVREEKEVLRVALQRAQEIAKNVQQHARSVKIQMEQQQADLVSRFSRELQEKDSLHAAQIKEWNERHLQELREQRTFLMTQQMESSQANEVLCELKLQYLNTRAELDKEGALKQIQEATDREKEELRNCLISHYTEEQLRISQLFEDQLANLSTNSKQAAEYEKQITVLTWDAEKLKADLQRTTEDRDRNVADLQRQLAAKCEEMQTSNETNKKQFKEILEKTVESMKAAHSREMADVQTGTAQLKKKLAEQQEEFVNRPSRQEDLNKIHDLEEKIYQLEENLCDAKNQLKNNSQNQFSIGAEYGRSFVGLDSLRGLSESSVSQDQQQLIGRIRKETDKQKQEKHDYLRRILDLENEERHLEEKLQRMYEEQLQMQGQDKQLHEKITSLEKQEERYKTIEEALKLKIEDLEFEVRKQREANDELDIQAVDLHEQLQKVRKEKENLQTQVRQQEEIIADRQRQGDLTFGLPTWIIWSAVVVGIVGASYFGGLNFGLVVLGVSFYLYALVTLAQARQPSDGRDNGDDDTS